MPTDPDQLLAIAALITAIGGVVIGLLNARNATSKQVVTDLRAEVERLKASLKERDTQHVEELAERERKNLKLRRRLRVVIRLLMDRESENNRLAAQNRDMQRKIDRLYEWGDAMGRKHNELELTLGALTYQLNHTQSDRTGTTAPLPALPEMPSLPPAPKTD